jgi:hypothetical protein
MFKNCKMKLQFLSIITTIFVLTACTKDFEEINTNPNVPVAVNPQFLLTNIVWNAANNNAVDAWNAGNQLGQLTARKDFNEIDRWDLRANQELWDKTYHLLNDVQTLIELGDEQNRGYTGVALVMRAFLSATLTDLWGDVPYSDALKGVSEGNFSPKYDTQEEIYLGENGILATLRQAVEILEQNKNGVQIKGDVMYGGDLDQWIRFANSLRLRYLLRISKQVDVSAEFAQLFTEGKLMQSNADNALVPYLASAPNQWFVHNIRSGDFGDVRMSLTIENALESLDDPRQAVWFRPTEKSVVAGTPAFAGIINGVGPATRGDYDFSEISLPGTIFREQPDGVDAVFMLYSEVQFALAEAAEKGWISGTPKEFYEEGISSSFEYFEAEMPVGYLTQNAVALGGQDVLKKIITQKWLASMLVGYEGWLEHRRTGFPELMVAAENLNNDRLPVRYLYPTPEQALNTANYQEAVSRIGGDNLDARGWWEK